MGSMSPTTWTVQPNTEVEALVVGGGFSGLYTLYKLRKEGIDAKLIEASKSLGGVWNHHRYPGARVDSKVPYYQYSMPEVYKTWDWRERFPGQEELLAYFDHVASTLHLYEHIAFQHNVIDCTFNSEARRWAVKTESEKEIRCRFLIVAAGSSYKKHYPTFKGLTEYTGTLLHAAGFPEDGYNFTGRKVAVIGQGATGIQIVQEVAKVAEKLTIFVRTPNMAIPMKQRNLSAEEQNMYKSVYDHLFRAARDSRSGLPYSSDGKTIMGVSKEERDAKWEELWARGGFNWNVGGYRDFLTDQKANDIMFEFWRKKTQGRIKDPFKASVFIPEKPPHPIGTKRASLEQDYYECIDRENVEVVNLKQTSIEAFNKDGIVTSDGKCHEFDVIVLATGYDSLTGSFTSMGLKDINGIDMKEVWKDGVRTQLGMTTPGFPNMFMVYSPQAPTALANGTTIIEIQGDWVTEAILKMKREGIEVIEANKDAAKKWASDIQDMNQKTLFPLTNSWYMGANIPGKKREQLNYLGGVNTYERVCKEARENWTGFDLTPAKTAA